MLRPLARWLLVLVVLVDVLTPDPVPRWRPCLHRLPALKFVDPVPSAARPFRRVLARFRPLEARLAVPPPIELQLCKDRWQEHLQPAWVLRVWHRGTQQLLAELPVPLLETMVAHYLSHAGLTAAVIELQTQVRTPLASAPIPPPLRALGVPLAPVQEARRAARARRVGRAGRKRQVDAQ